MTIETMTPRDFAMRCNEIGCAAAYAEATDRPEWGELMTRRIPDYMQYGLATYVLFGITSGSFLTALLEGNLFGALRQADDVNFRHLPEYAHFLHNAAPAGCFGSEARVEEWSKDGGLKGVMSRRAA